MNNAPQSFQSMIVDCAIVGAVVYLAVQHITDAAVWSMFSVMVGARFGIAAGKIASRPDGGGTSLRPPPG